MDCPALDAERARVLTTLEAASGDHQSKTSRDAFAAFAGVTISPILHVLATGQSSAGDEVSRLKGEFYAVERALLAKSCPVSTNK